ncbi:MAG: peptide chain release factor N(5)-glutamine methyltransferase [Lachnospiraceae bacterium]|nr:peptide chain release factor N(5)-glutamine methyltransferase [Lachnospiraceae bacterium]
MNYKEIYLWGREVLEKASVPEFELDARLLLEHICHTNRNTLLVHGDRVVTSQEENEYRDAIALRCSRIPLQHITGVQEFMGLEFMVNRHVLCPRQDTECLVEEVMRYLHDGDRILDMCTGSGCILLSLLHYSNYCSGVGVDISKEALKVACENAKKIATMKRPNPWKEDAVKFLQSDLFMEVKEEEFDIIVSNPPYIASDVIPTLMEEVRLHEPMSALDGMEDGLFFYRKIVEESQKYMIKDGMLFFEIGHDQGKAVSELMEKAGFSEVTVVKDFAGLDRVVYGRLLYKK